MNILERKSESWWRRPCGGFDVLRQAVPLIISCGSISFMNFTDRMFLMWLDPNSMSAAMLGMMLFGSVIAIPVAITAFVTTFVAQYYGSGNYNRIGVVVWQGIWFGFIFVPILFLFESYFVQLFVLFKHEGNLIQQENLYFHYLLWGSAATISGEAAAAFFRGRGKMHIEMYNNLFCVVLNIFLDYCMIFGKCGFPAWGLAGAAIATMISQWVRLAIYIVLIFWADIKEKRYNILGGMKPDFKLFGRLLYYGTPSSSYSFIDMATFTLFLMIIGGLGEFQRNATTIAFTMNSFTFIPLTGIGIVVTSMVGNQLGNNRPDLARRVTNTAFVIGCIYTGFFVVLFIAVPDFLLSAFAVFSDAEEFESLRDLTVILLRFIALCVFFDSCALIAGSTLRGAGDTIFVMRVVFIVAPLLPILCWLGIRCFGFGLMWCWIILTANVIAYFIFFVIRFCGKKWETTRVIEKELQKTDTEAGIGDRLRP
ncbi:MAG: MATE family efflux transporter [Planctomycetaceae bacterium]|jgi:MATE family multidrug resistance protein|nr:MATE family efflux transporter [Planctomycetaceae bacterium]